MGREWADIKAATHQVDLLLEGVQPDGSASGRHMTVCHGDFKAANILFSEDGTR